MTLSASELWLTPASTSLSLRLYASRFVFPEISSCRKHKGTSLLRTSGAYGPDESVLQQYSESGFKKHNHLPFSVIKTNTWGRNKLRNNAGKITLNSEKGQKSQIVKRKKGGKK